MLMVLQGWSSAWGLPVCLVLEQFVVELIPWEQQCSFV
jgi:hypothetical protein